MKLNYDKDSDSISKEPSIPEISEMVGGGRMLGERPFTVEERPFTKPMEGRLKKLYKSTKAKLVGEMPHKERTGSYALLAGVTYALGFPEALSMALVSIAAYETIRGAVHKEEGKRVGEGLLA